MEDYRDFFRRMTSGFEPHAWQAGLAAHAGCANRLIRIPTGFGKTLGLLGAWPWNRVAHGREDWPRRLVWCLPMRVLVEQANLEGFFKNDLALHPSLIHWRRKRIFLFEQFKKSHYNSGF